MNKQKKIFLCKDCFFQDVEDSMFILNSKTGQYHELNNSGKYIIEMVDSNSYTFDELFKRINESSFNLDKNDVLKFIESLLEREIIMYLK